MVWEALNESKVCIWNRRPKTIVRNTMKSRIHKHTHLPRVSSVMKLLFWWVKISHVLGQMSTCEDSALFFLQILHIINIGTIHLRSWQMFTPPQFRTQKLHLDDYLIFIETLLLEVWFYMNGPSKLNAPISSKQFFGLKFSFE